MIILKFELDQLTEPGRAWLDTLRKQSLRQAELLTPRGGVIYAEIDGSDMLTIRTNQGVWRVPPDEPAIKKYQAGEVTGTDAFTVIAQDFAEYCQGNAIEPVDDPNWLNQVDAINKASIPKSTLISAVHTGKVRSIELANAPNPYRDNKLVWWPDVEERYG